jgi:hypothetical protein
LDEPLELDVDDLAPISLLLASLMEQDDLVHAVEELRPETAPAQRAITSSRTAS